jgi:hypothetical protein
VKRITTKLEFSEIEDVYSVKDTVKRMRKQVIDWEKYLQNISNVGLSLKILKKLLKFNS